MTINIHWFRRDLRLNDNAALYHALKSDRPTLPIFIFDKNILDILEERDDARVSFLHNTLSELKSDLEKMGSTLAVFYGTPQEIWQKLATDFSIETVFTNHDYEPLRFEAR
ncbi:MAG: deoxyribodipyrimidine photo-lyase, partial [Saprospiraceae bacterium]|nr:deoxyribodipyrimidine photo-lyase [Saprospiraceae bacterium]